MSAFRGNRSMFNLNLGKQISGFIKNNSPLHRLILANVGVYLAVLLLGLAVNLACFLQGKASENFGEWVLRWLSVPSNPWVLLTRPWTIITSIFLHADFWHIFFNMLMLWVGGKIFLYFFPKKKIYTVYIWGGIIGNIIFVLSYNLFPVFSDVVQQAIAMGASAGVLAVLIAACAKAPNYQLSLVLLGNVSLKWVAVAMVVIDIISIPGGNSGGHFAHLGGSLFGFLYVYIPKWNTLLKSSPSVKARPAKGSRPKSDEQYNAERAAYRKKVDEILDKVAQSGYQSLSTEEKEFLFKTSNRKNW